MLIEIHADSKPQPGQPEPGRPRGAQDLLFRRGLALAHFQPVHQAKHPHERGVHIARRHSYTAVGEDDRRGVGGKAD